MDAKIVKDFISILKDEKQSVSPYDSTATVTRIDGQTAWVHIPGGVDETPVAMAVNAQAGDTVRIRVSGGQAWITGNDTAPPTDDTTAKEAGKTAEVAVEKADTAQENAERAAKAADDAQESADTANAAAETATTAANNALTQLSVVEDVVGTLNWISEHGSYAATSDTAVVPGKLYFTRTGSGTSSDPYVYEVVTEPASNPATAGYYELDSIDEAVAHYVSTHLALTNSGLYVVSDSSGYKVRIASDRVEIIDGSGNVVNTMSSNLNRVGRSDKSHVDVSSEAIRMLNNDQLPLFGADMNGSVETINNNYSVLLNRLQTQASVPDDTEYHWMYSNSVNINGDDESTFSVNSAWLIIRNVQDVSHVFEYETNTVSSSGICSNVLAAQNQISFGIPLEEHTIGTSFRSEGTIAVYANATKSSGSGTTRIRINYKFIVTYDGASKITLEMDGRIVQSGASTSARVNTSGLLSVKTQVTLKSPAYFLGIYSGTLGKFATAIGRAIYASGDDQIAFGRYNEEDTEDDYVLIAGNGSDEDNRSNAFAVTWDGNLIIAINTTAEAGTTDGDLYAAITDLGWGSEVIV